MPNLREARVRKCDYVGWFRHVEEVARSRGEQCHFARWRADRHGLASRPTMSCRRSAFTPFRSAVRSADVRKASLQLRLQAAFVELHPVRARLPGAAGSCTQKRMSTASDPRTDPVGNASLSAPRLLDARNVRLKNARAAQGGPSVRVTPKHCV